MNNKPGHSYFIDFKPTANNVDIVPRIQQGIRQAKADGFDLVFIVEDDDFFPSNYFDNIPDTDFIGSEKTTYYNLKNRTYQDWTHPRRSSLFTTGFKISALNDFQWPEHQERFLDLSIWNYGSSQRKKTIGWRETGAIGIKHGIGLCGGRGHMQRNKYFDNHEMDWLKGKVDSEAFEFYKSLKV